MAPLFRIYHLGTFLCLSPVRPSPAMPRPVGPVGTQQAGLAPRGGGTRCRLCSGTKGSRHRGGRAPSFSDSWMYTHGKEVDKRPDRVQKPGQARGTPSPVAQMGRQHLPR